MKYAVFFVAFLSLWPIGCASLNCGVVQPGGDPLIELAYVSGDDAPTMTILRLFSGAYRNRERAVLEFEPLGQRRRCRSLVDAEARKVKLMLAAASFQDLLAREIEKGNDLGIHERVLSLKVHRQFVQRRPEVISPELLKSITSVEALFRRVFPRLSAEYLPFSVEGFSDSDANPLIEVTSGPSDNLSSQPPDI